MSAGPSFEQARDELEQIVRKLEDGSTSPAFHMSCHVE